MRIVFHYIVQLFAKMYIIGDSSHIICHKWEGENLSSIKMTQNIVF